MRNLTLKMLLGLLLNVIVMQSVFFHRYLYFHNLCGSSQTSIVLYNFQLKHSTIQSDYSLFIWLTEWLQVQFTAAAVAACIISAESVPASSHVMFYICQYHNIIWKRNGNSLFQPIPMGDVESFIFKLAQCKINAASKWQRRIEKIVLLLVIMVKLHCGYAKPTATTFIVSSITAWNSGLNNDNVGKWADVHIQNLKCSPTSFTCAEH